MSSGTVRVHHVQRHGAGVVRDDHQQALILQVQALEPGGAELSSLIRQNSAAVLVAPSYHLIHLCGPL